MRLDELFKPANAVRWSKRGDRVVKKPVETPMLRALTKFEPVKSEKE